MWSGRSTRWFWVIFGKPPKWIQRVQQLAIQDHKRWHHSYKSVWSIQWSSQLFNLILMCHLHNHSPQKKLILNGYFETIHLGCCFFVQCQANATHLSTPAPPSVLWPHYLRWASCCKLHTAYLLGRSIWTNGISSNHMVERWKHLSLRILDSQVQSSLNLWFSRETTTLQHQDADGIHHRPFKIQLWQCPILHACGTWHGRSGFCPRCFGSQNAMLVSVAWCWIMCLTLWHMKSSTYIMYPLFIIPCCVRFLMTRMSPNLRLLKHQPHPTSPPTSRPTMKATAIREVRFGPCEAREAADHTIQGLLRSLLGWPMIPMMSSWCILVTWDHNTFSCTNDSPNPFCKKNVIQLLAIQLNNSWNDPQRFDKSSSARRSRNWTRNSSWLQKVPMGGNKNASACRLRTYIVTVNSCV